ncbi:Trp biosynthesis-associated membrane protein [Sphaerimonospora sp. CA-214678]|uniref:Trp biosynthesis-associated membrane protein n=1 Tax=Sphaerimonospora sp. CA-214678 TaxID=3240029 RepID=UPI003D943274
MTGSGTATVRTARRSLVIWLAACAAGAGLVLLAAGRTWATAVFGPEQGRIGAGRVDLTGGDLVAWLTPAALAALAALAAVLAARGVARRVIGVVIALFGAAIVAGAWDGTRTPTIVAAARENITTAVVSSSGFATTVSQVWPWAAAAGGLILVAGGVTAVIRAGHWPGMSGKYDRPGGGNRTPGGPDGGGRTGERAMWDALDEGVDPTSS